MKYVFEVIDKSGRKIHLSKERWTHINTEHPELANYFEELKETLVNPSKITTYIYDENIKYYYKYLKEPNLTTKYLLVIVKYLNGKGFIITAYFMRNIK